MTLGGQRGGATLRGFASLAAVAGRGPAPRARLAAAKLCEADRVPKLLARTDAPTAYAGS